MSQIYKFYLLILLFYKFRIRIEAYDLYLNDRDKYLKMAKESAQKLQK